MGRNPSLDELHAEFAALQESRLLADEEDARQFLHGFEEAILLEDPSQNHELSVEIVFDVPALARAFSGSPTTNTRYHLSGLQPGRREIESEIFYLTLVRAGRSLHLEIRPREWPGNVVELVRARISTETSEKVVRPPDLVTDGSLTMLLGVMDATNMFESELDLHSSYGVESLNLKVLFRET